MIILHLALKKRPPEKGNKLKIISWDGKRLLFLINFPWLKPIHFTVEKTSFLMYSTSFKTGSNTKTFLSLLLAIAESEIISKALLLDKSFCIYYSNCWEKSFFQKIFRFVFSTEHLYVQADSEFVDTKQLYQNFPL